MHKWHTAGKGQVESTREQADKKHEDKRLRKIVNLKGKSKKRYWKDFKVVPDNSHLICQDIKRNKKAYHVNILSDKVFSCIHEHTVLLKLI